MITWLKHRWRVYLRRKQLEKDLKDELQFYTVMREEQLRSAGRRPDAAQEARRRFGNMTRLEEECRDVWTFAPLERFWSDVLYAVRSLRKAPVITAGIVLSLTLGIGVTAGTFSLIDSLMLLPLAVPHTENVLRILMETDRGTTDQISYADFKEIRDRSDVFGNIGADDIETIGLAITGTEQARFTVAEDVTPSFFETLQIQPQLGRSFRPEESTEDDTVTVISYNLWLRDFELAPDVLGRTVRVNGKSFTIIGVMPKAAPNLNHLIHPELYLPFKSKQADNRALNNASVVARLKPGVSVGKAKQEILAIAGTLEQEFPETNRGRRLIVLTQRENDLLHKDDLAVASLFMTVVSLVLVIGCVNVVNLFLSKAPGRAQA